jgi:norsolorinic acid ketoreductase
MHNEIPEITALALNPGWVATDLGNHGATSNGMSQAPVTQDDSVTGMLSRIDGATREKSGGKFWNFKPTKGNAWDVDTDEVPW